MRLKRRAATVSNAFRSFELPFFLAVNSILIGLVVAVFRIPLDPSGVSRIALFAQIASVLVTLIYTLLTYSYVHATYAILTETRDARLAQSRPRVLVHFQRNADRLYVVVGHFGGGPATDVRFRFSPPLTNQRGDNVGEKPPLSTGIPMLPPGEKLSVYFAEFQDYQTDWGANNLLRRGMGAPIPAIPSRFDVTVTLRDPLADDAEYETTYALDLEHLMDYAMLSDGRDAAEGPLEDGPGAE